MNTIIVIGAPGMGKSPIVQSFFTGKNEDKAVFVNDIQNEYGGRPKYPGNPTINLSNNVNDRRSRYIGNNIEEFIDLCAKKRNTICVFEEATVFFEGRTKQKMRKHLIDRFHTGNVTYLLFHSISSVPPRIMEMANYVILLKTNDEAQTVARKYSRLLPYFEDLQKKEKGSYHVIQIL